MMWWGHGFSWEWMFAGGLMMILFWGGLIALVFVAVRALSRTGSQQPVTNTGWSNTAVNILEERYARGESSNAEYKKMRTVLET